MEDNTCDEENELFIKNIFSQKNEKIDGEFIKYYPNGNVDIKCTYQNGKLNGECTAYYQNGKERMKCTYINGKKRTIY